MNSESVVSVTCTVQCWCQRQRQTQLRCCIINCARFMLTCSINNEVWILCLCCVVCGTSAWEHDISTAEDTSTEPASTSTKRWWQRCSSTQGLYVLLISNGQNTIEEVAKHFPPSPHLPFPFPCPFPVFPSFPSFPLLSGHFPSLRCRPSYN